MSDSRPEPTAFEFRRASDSLTQSIASRLDDHIRSEEEFWREMRDMKEGMDEIRKGLVGDAEHEGVFNAMRRIDTDVHDIKVRLSKLENERETFLLTTTKNVGRWGLIVLIVVMLLFFATHPEDIRHLIPKI